ncbi:MAG: family 10 glycosylhydrolase, partial [Acidobacteria bacterium]|nr:family 10 glycosylhydrolase [Acidobacteriota bacterium]
YGVAGVHLDYVRFPNEAFDFSRASLQQFKANVRPQLTETERRRVDGQETSNPLAYTMLFPDRWNSFRQSRLTTLVMRVRTAVKAVRPDLTVSVAVVPDATAAAASRMQDWRTWLDQSLIDVLCPMAYTQDRELFEQQIRTAQAFAGQRPVWAGVGAYRLSASATLDRIAAARRHKAAGIILFSYESLVTPPNSATSLTELGRAAFGNGFR